MGVCRGRALRPGDCVGITAPSSPVVTAQLVWSAVDFLYKSGYTVKLGQTTAVRAGYLAGADILRAAEINAFFADETVAAVLCLRGGYGSARLLDYLDYTIIADNPKLFIGYSDITALHIALFQRSHLATVHGPVAAQLASANDYTQNLFRRGLTGRGILKLPPGRELITLTAGRAFGRLVGGNLAVLASLVGTPYELDGRGCILFIEEIGEAPYRIDRMLNQLWQSGLLRRVSGLVFGDFTACTDDFGNTADEVIRYYADLSGKPSLAGLTAGHGEYNMFLPFGVMAAINEAADSALFTITENYTVQ